jgi:hypothetical protein
MPTNRKKLIYALFLPLVVVGGLVFANHEIKNETAKKSAPGPLTAKSQKELAGAANIKQPTSASSNMEAVIISLSLPQGSRSGFKVMVRINGYHYMLNLGQEKANDFEQLYSLKVNDKIMISSRSVFSASYAPRHDYPIIAGDYVERDGKIIYKRAHSTGGC